MNHKHTFLLLILTLGTAIQAQPGKLPEWVKEELKSYDRSAIPEDAGVWRLLDETTIRLQRDGRFKKTRRVVQIVLQERRALGASIYLIDGDEKETKIKKLMGWHRNRAGKVKTLDKNNVITVGNSSGYRLVNDTTTLAHFKRVGKGSVVAFESQEIRKSFFSVESVMPATGFPIKKRVVTLVDRKSLKQDPVFEAVNMASWGIHYEVDRPKRKQTRFTAYDLPAIEYEHLAPDSDEFYPRLLVGFLDTDRTNEPLASWDNLAKWYLKEFNAKAKGAARSGGVDQEALAQLHQWFRHNTTYKQRYLSLARGWIPAEGEQVEKRGYGDCKDLVSCMAWRAAKKDIQVLPVLASVADSLNLKEHDKVSPWFNHVIAAVPLEQSLGFPAEVEVKGQRYLLVDPTDRYARLGYLPTEYEDRWVMICTPEGAAWTAVPDQALEMDQVTVQLSGDLSDDHTLSGTLTILAEGDAYGLRTEYLRGNPMDLEYKLRNTVGFPGVAELEAEARELDEADRLKLSFRIKWPGFMRRDAYGYRLPRFMTGLPQTSLDLSERQHPIALGGRVDEVWRVDVTGSHNFQPGVADFQLKDAARDYSWKASGGTNLKVMFARRYNPKVWNKDELAEAGEVWESFREKFNAFYRTGTLFIPTTHLDTASL